MADGDEDERAFARGNPWARALRPAPDAARPRSAVAIVLFRLLSLLVAAIFLAALVLPLLFTGTLLVRGYRTGHWGMLSAGLVMAALYAALLRRK